MSGAFQYRPKFVDIRVRPQADEEAAREADVHHLKPGERQCDYAGCPTVATAKAPKSRNMLNEHYWFCQPHAAEYNRNWNFFSGMTDEERERRVTEELKTGGRPTWEMKAGRFSREAASFSAKLGTRNAGGYRDPFNLFGGGGPQAQVKAETSRRLGKIERNALAELDLADSADGSEIRARYTELVKRFHPDSNGGDRSSEPKLQRVIRAYQSLRKVGMV